ncbi:MAG: MurT ligase domain-containing protein [Gracilibacteraceae bacterium]|jgi:UDP-N-acetylmuramyl tripeptide synthase/drug/metabolite transporter (DMT)-like permease|nr:MurT ligase domain-containing protein [Gracilibacteraceae bacterium]
MKSGLCFILLAGVLWSTAGALVKYLTWAPLTVVCLRSIFATGVLLLYARKKNALRFKWSKNIIVAALCLTITMCLYITAVKLTVAANAILLQYTAPAFIVLYAALFRRSRPQPLEIITCLVIYAGAALLFFDKIGGGYWLGNLLGLFSGVTFGAVCFANTLEDANPPVAVLLGNAALILLLPLTLADPALAAASGREWLVIILLGVCQLGGGYLFFCEGISRVPAFTAAVAATVEPVLTPVWVLLAFGEKPGPFSLAGGGIVIAAILVYNYLRVKREQGEERSGAFLGLALGAGRLTALVLKLSGRRGTTLPGAVARRLCPGLPSILSRAYPDGVVAVTGTNGKTTTNNILAAIMQAAGKKTALNSEGANMLNGICTALLRDADRRGRVRGDIFLAEVDEGSLPEFCRAISPRLVVVTNFFRDQLDRYGELDTTVAKVREALPPDAALLLNADDPLAAQLAAGHSRVIFYGVAALPGSSPAGGESREGRFCPRCGAPLAYTLFHYGQLGHYACSACAFRRPAPEAEATRVRSAADGFAFTLAELEYRTALGGGYNLYNALAALAAARWLGAPAAAGQTALRDFAPRDGRMEEFRIDDGLTLILVKNPTGFNAVLEAISGGDRPLRLLLAINDLAADGRDISWLWDVDFELLGAGAAGAGGAPPLRQVVCSGRRGADILLRLKYAGLNREILVCEPDCARALALLRRFPAGPEERVFVLPTYTALAPLRALLRAAERQGGKKA